MEDDKRLALRQSLQNQLVEYFTDVPEDFTKAVNYVMCKEGVREVRHSPLADFVVEPEKMTNLKSLPTGIQLRIPKVPYHFVCQIFSFFKAISERDNTEAAALIFWNQETQQHFIHIPRQTNSGGGAHFDQDEEYALYRRTMVPVMELHSHNSMGAFWSGTDNTFEKFPQFYIVMGKVQTNMEYLVRYACSGKYYDCKLFDIVEEPPLVLHITDGVTRRMKMQNQFISDGMEFPKEWMDKVEKPTPTIFQAGNRYFGKHNTPPYVASEVEDDSVMGFGRGVMKDWEEADKKKQATDQQPQDQQTQETQTQEVEGESQEMTPSEPLGTVMDTIRSKMRLLKN